MKRVLFTLFLLLFCTRVMTAGVLLIDDFPSGDSWAVGFNALGQTASYNTHGNSTLLADVIETIRYGSSGGSLRLMYNQPTTLENDAWYWWTFIKGIDVTVYDSLTFHVRGEWGGEKLKVGFEDAWGQGAYVYLDDVLEQGVTTAWQKVTVYFEDLGMGEHNDPNSKVDKYSIQLFIIKNDDRTAHSSTVYIDNIELNINGKLVVEDFDIKDFKANYLGGRTDGETDNSVSGDIGCSLFWGADPTNAYGGKGDSLKVAYFNPADSGNVTNYWTLFSFLRSEGGYDLTLYNELSFKVKGTSGNEVFRIALKDNSSFEGVKGAVEITNYIPAGVTTNWQDVTIPLTAFSGCDLSIIKSVEFFMDYLGTGLSSGAFFIDDLKVQNSGNSSELLIDDFDQSYRARNNLGESNRSETSGDSTLTWSVIKNEGQEAEEFYRDYGVEYSRVGGSLKLEYSSGDTADK
ncbi:MAG: hypothetical protein KKH98_12075, partial [Spirochaetes bacterium]|nr:hypothetical protein [Spirochaetota bacterium]